MYMYVCVAVAAALYILYPGLYLAGALFYFLTMLVLRRDIRRYRIQEYTDLCQKQILEETAGSKESDDVSDDDQPLVGQ